MDICQRIDNILDERGISRRQLALSANIPPTTLQSALSRKKNITTEMLQKIAIALEVEVSQLLQIETDKEFEGLFDMFPNAAIKEDGSRIGIQIAGSNIPHKKKLSDEVINAFREGIVTRYDQMNENGKQKLFEYADDLFRLQKYREHL